MHTCTYVGMVRQWCKVKGQVMTQLCVSPADRRCIFTCGRLSFGPCCLSA